jgi:putative glutamine amidotransferase
MVALAAAQKTSPVIGISGGNADSASVRAMMTQIQSAGGTPIFLGNHAARNAEADVQKLDALVVMGNNQDIDPAKYGAAKDPHTNVETDAARANYEEQMLLKAMARKVPVLGVCGGMQRINVLMGGSLVQHIPDALGHNNHAQQDQGIAPFVPVQLVSIMANSSLRGISGDMQQLYSPARSALPPGVVLENSMHHQAVGKLGTGLRINAISNELDGKHVIEGIEVDPNFEPLKDQFIMGVQWHPEFSASPLGARIADTLVGKAREYSQQHPREQSAAIAQEENVLSAMPQVKHPEAIGGMTAMILRQRADNAQRIR